MEPVPVTRGVRRTVRVAVALLVGQALLGALIGWMTLGPSLTRPAPGPGVDRVAAMPIRKPMPTEEGGLVIAPPPAVSVDRPHSSTSSPVVPPAVPVPPPAPPASSADRPASPPLTFSLAPSPPTPSPPPLSSPAPSPSAAPSAPVAFESTTPPPAASKVAPSLPTPTGSPPSRPGFGDSRCTECGWRRPAAGEWWRYGDRGWREPSRY